eukprot:TRINITY_DN4401_c0_g1_i1.p1 TRINITY_DN4401_c0_g1~~TRINITY_DN4401_c0_g1_i1.p1  ORF type:complete len:255 (+),score=39.26 TRINITY_DN4401_c0_g1_i1:109-873(+)
MTIETFFGCAFLAYGPPLALFAVTIAADPVRVIILIISAFVWLLSLLFSALLWLAVVPLRHEMAFGVVFSVLFQEGFRLGFYLLLRKADSYLRKLARTEPTQIFLNPHILAYTVGLGFGLMSGAFSMMNVLADVLGPGTVGLKGEPQSFFVVSGVMTLCMILLHVCWNVIFFSSINRGSYLLSVIVVGFHLLVSCLSLLNTRYLYLGSVVPSYLVLMVSIVLAAREAGASIHSLRKAFAGGQILEVNAAGAGTN